MSVHDEYSVPYDAQVIIVPRPASYMPPHRELRVFRDQGGVTECLNFTTLEWEYGGPVGTTFDIPDGCLLRRQIEVRR